MHRKGFTHLAARSKFRKYVHFNEETCTGKALLISPQGLKFRKYVHFNEATCTGKALLVSPQGQSSENMSTSMRQHAQERLYSSRLKVKVQKICPFQ